MGRVGSLIQLQNAGRVGLGPIYTFDPRPTLRCHNAERRPAQRRKENPQAVTFHLAGNERISLVTCQWKPSAGRSAVTSHVGTFVDDAKQSRAVETRDMTVHCLVQLVDQEMTDLTRYNSLAASCSAAVLGGTGVKR